MDSAEGCILYVCGVEQTLPLCCPVGVLCGSCVEGTSVTSIYSHCKVCHAAVGVVFIVIGERTARAHTHTHTHTLLSALNILYSHLTFICYIPVVVAAAAMFLILVFNVKLPPWMFSLLFYIRVRATHLYCTCSDTPVLLLQLL